MGWTSKYTLDISNKKGYNIRCWKNILVFGSIDFGGGG